MRGTGVWLMPAAHQVVDMRTPPATIATPARQSERAFSLTHFATTIRGTCILVCQGNALLALIIVSDFEIIPLKLYRKFKGGEHKHDGCTNVGVTPVFGENVSGAKEIAP
jgi:hypothetical protein